MSFVVPFEQSTLDALLRRVMTPGRNPDFDSISGPSLGVYASIPFSRFNEAHPMLLIPTSSSLSNDNIEQLILELDGQARLTFGRGFFKFQRIETHVFSSWDSSSSWTVHVRIGTCNLAFEANHRCIDGYKSVFLAGHQRLTFVTDEDGPEIRRLETEVEGLKKRVQQNSNDIKKNEEAIKRLRDKRAPV